MTQYQPRTFAVGVIIAIICSIIAFLIALMMRGNSTDINDVNKLSTLTDSITNSNLVVYSEDTLKSKIFLQKQWDKFVDSTSAIERIKLKYHAEYKSNQVMSTIISIPSNSNTNTNENIIYKEHVYIPAYRNSRWVKRNQNNIVNKQ